jgi:hypothetical protein
VAVTTQCTFTDESGEVRLEGTIGAPGATAANVLTAGGAGGTSWSPPSGAGGLFMASHAGTPVLAVIPTGVGYLIVDSTNGALYQATGLTNADWVQIGGLVATASTGVKLTAGQPSWAIQDSAAAGGLHVDDSTDNGTPNMLVGTPSNTLDDGTALGSMLLLSGFGAWTHGAPATQPAVTGALSTVLDAPAKAVLTSIIAALVAYGLATNGTT